MRIVLTLLNLQHDQAPGGGDPDQHGDEDVPEQGQDRQRVVGQLVANNPSESGAEGLFRGIVEFYIIW